MIEPIYDENIIIAIKKNKELNWYIADKFLWIMNLELLSKKELEGYFLNEELRKVRNNCKIVSNENIEIFLDNIKKYKVSIDLLKLKILERISKKGIDDEELDDFSPSLLIDFDNNILYSQYPEPFSFENYVPKNWIGKYASFIELIDLKDRYWMHKGKNLLGF